MVQHTTLGTLFKKKKKAVFSESKVDRGEWLMRQVEASRRIKVFQCHVTELGLPLRGQ